jgi:predicted AAA+ superfamily ATPase
MPDIGLLLTRTLLDYKTYIEPNNKIFNHYKGIIAEQFVFQELRATLKSMPIYFWSNNKNTAEIEFVIQYDGATIPIEVKSGKNTKSASLKSYRDLFKPALSVRASLNNYHKDNGLTDIPLYMISEIAAIIAR